MSDDPLDVSGSWDGIFNYPRGVPSNAFRAELVEHAGAISGETHERSDAHHDRGATVVALLDGRRSGTDISFTKRYDDLVRAGHPVSYTGALSSEGDEITGTWNIPGEWSGTFIMVRQTRAGSAAKQQVEETVR